MCWGQDLSEAGIRARRIQREEIGALALAWPSMFAKMKFSGLAGSDSEARRKNRLCLGLPPQSQDLASREQRIAWAIPMRAEVPGGLSLASYR